jgi:hypothetical protein
VKRKVFEMTFSTYETYYDNLSHILSNILDRNPGNHFDVLHFLNPRGGHSILQRVFHYNQNLL